MTSHAQTVEARRLRRRSETPSPVARFAAAVLLVGLLISVLQMLSSGRVGAPAIAFDTIGGTLVVAGFFGLPDMQRRLYVPIGWERPLPPLELSWDEPPADGWDDNEWDADEGSVAVVDVEVDWEGFERAVAAWARGRS